MSNGKQTRTSNTFKYEDFIEYLPKRTFHEKQEKFFRNTFDVVTQNNDTTKVTCFAARPGVGKSTFINTFMHCCLGDKSLDRRHEPQGLVVVTDSIKRLEELSDSERDRKEAEDYWGEYFYDLCIDYHYKDFERNVIVLHAGESLKEQLSKQYYKPIVLLSTQRYFMMSEKIREQLFQFNYYGNKLKRDIVIFDECPYFSETINITSVNLTRIEAALYEGLTDEVEQKQFVVKEFKEFKDRLLDVMDEKERLRKDSNVILYWKDPNRTTMTHNDNKFFEVIESNIDALTKQYNAIMKDLLCLKEIAQNGAIFNSVKKRNGNYERSFVLVKDNRDAFYLGKGVKFFVFDATADIDPRYNLDYVDIVGGEAYDNRLNLQITNVKMPTSKNALANSGKKSFAITNAIINYLKSKNADYRKILIVTYGILSTRFKKDFDNVCYFGNLKGFNDFKDLYKMAHVGMNRYPPMAYFYIYCGCNMDVYNSLSSMTEEDTLKLFDDITSNKSEEYQEALDNIMIHCMLADFEQNIFRLAIRDYNNEDKVEVWTFYNSEHTVYNSLSSLIEKRFKPFSVVFKYEDAPEELLLEKAKNRKPPNDKEKTHAQKIIEWRDSLPTGKEYKTKDLLEATGLTNKQLQKAKGNNNVLANLFKSDETNKKGYYVKTS